MRNQFITNNKGERIAAVIPISEFEDLLHKQHLNQELANDYNLMIDLMLDEEEKGTAEYLTFKRIKERFFCK